MGLAGSPSLTRALVSQCHSNEDLQGMRLPLSNEHLKYDSLTASRLDSSQQWKVCVDCGREIVGVLGTPYTLSTLLLPASLFPQAAMHIIVYHKYSSSNAFFAFIAFVCILYAVYHELRVWQFPVGISIISQDSNIESI